MRKSIIIFALCCCVVFSGCSRRDNVARNDKGLTATPLIAVSIIPQAWFVSRIGGERVQTLVLAGPGQNPHNYEPSPQQISGLVNAGAWILSGTEFEISLRPKIEKLFPALPIVDGTAGVSFRTMEGHGHDEHENELSPLEVDRHTWLGREPAKILAGHVMTMLSALDPASIVEYVTNYQALLQEIDNEFDTLRRELAPLQGKNVFVYHPSFGYFLDEFGIVQHAVETGGKTPSPRVLAQLITQAQQEQPAAIFVQAQFPATAAKTVANAVGAELISLDPLAPDWLDNIRYMGEMLQRGIRSP